jgi:hypothetical protein
MSTAAQRRSRDCFSNSRAIIVIGTASTMPIEPHAHPQKISDNSTTSGEIRSCPAHDVGLDDIAQNHVDGQEAARHCNDRSIQPSGDHQTDSQA